MLEKEGNNWRSWRDVNQPGARPNEFSRGLIVIPSNPEFGAGLVLRSPIAGRATAETHWLAPEASPLSIRFSQKGVGRSVRQTSALKQRRLYPVLML